MKANRVPVVLTDMITELQEVLKYATALKMASNSKNKSVTASELVAAYQRHGVTTTSSVVSKVRRVMEAIGPEGLEIMKTTMSASMENSETFTYSSLVNGGLCNEDVPKDMRLRILSRISSAASAGIRECTTEKVHYAVVGETNDCCDADVVCK